MNIYLVRHGQTDFNRNGQFQGTTDVYLNAEGIKQAESIGKRLQARKLDIIYASNHKRVQQTANIIGGYIGSGVIIREELREIDMGEWEALNHEQLRASYGSLYNEWSKHEKDISYPGGECGEDVEKRAIKVINEIIGADYEEVVIVTSGGTIRVLLCSFLGLNQGCRFSFDTDNCGLSIVRYDRTSGKYYVNCINDTTHLQYSASYL